MAEHRANIDGFLGVMVRLQQGEAVSLTELREALGIQTHAHTRLWRDRLRRALPGLRESKQGREKVLVVDDGAEEATHVARAVGLEFAVDALSPLEGTQWHEALQRLRDAEQARVKRLRHLADDLRDGFSVNPGGLPMTPRPEVVSALATAWRERRVVALTYERADGERRRRSVEPWGLVLRGDHALLMAGAHGKRPRERRHYRLDRVLSVEPLEDRFQRPTSKVFDLERLVRESWGVWMTDEPPVEVRVLVRNGWAGLLRNFRRHPTQVNGEPVERDGQTWLPVTWTVRPCEELVSDLLAMLPDVVVLAPDGLRTRMLVRAREGAEVLAAGCIDTDR